MASFTSFILSILQNYGILKISVFLLSFALVYILGMLVVTFLSNKGVLVMNEKHRNIVLLIFSLAFAYVTIQLEQTISLFIYLTSAFAYISFLVVFILALALFSGANTGSGAKVPGLIIGIILSLIFIYVLWYTYYGQKSSESQTGPNLLLAPEVLYVIIFLIALGTVFILIERKWT